MAVTSRLIIFLVFVLTAVTPLPTTDIDFTFVVEGINNAISSMHHPKKTKDAFFEQYINVGYYSSNFIELLDSYMTLTDRPTNFDEEEKRILTSNSIEASIEHKVRTQLKYYRKMQEVQCMNYFILHYNLYNTDRIIEYREILQHIYNMIEMAYVGNFVVVPLLWKLHISLLSVKASVNNIIPKYIMDSDFEQFRKPLGELVNMCVTHRYITQILNCINDALQNASCPRVKIFSKTILIHNNDKSQKHFNFSIDKYRSPISINYLFLEDIMSYGQKIAPITTVKFIMDGIYNDLKYNIMISSDKFITREYKTDPFKHIEVQQTFLDIVRLKLYCFIWLQLFAYQKVNSSEFRERHDSFMKMISEIVELIQIKDKKLNHVLTLYCKIGESNYEQIEEVLKILKTEVNNILLPYEDSKETKLADISNVELENEDAVNLFLDKVEKECQEFGNIFKTTLVGFSYDFLLFFINGSNNSDFTIFPKY